MAKTGGDRSPDGGGPSPQPRDDRASTRPSPTPAAVLERARAETVDDLRSATLVGVVRATSEPHTRAIVEGLMMGGLRAVELTATTPGCFRILADLSKRARGVVLGVGTVRSVEDLAAARAAGARFVASPHTDAELIKLAAAAGLVSIPGAFTPTEIVAARSAGADFVKLFPVSAGGGPSYLRWLRGPLPDVPFWVSGDVGLSDIGPYLDAGAKLVGLTSTLTENLEGIPPEHVPDQVAERAAACLAAASEARDVRVMLELERNGRKLQVDLRALRRLPGTEHVSIETVVPGRRGHGTRIRRLIEHLGFAPTESVTLESADGFRRELTVSELIAGGVLQYAVDGRPLEPSEGGPLRLFVINGTDRCDNIKGLARIAAVTHDPP